MNKNIYCGLILAVCMSTISAPLLAEVAPASEQHTNTAVPATSAEHIAAAELQKKHSVYHKGLANQERSIAAVYGSLGKRILGDRHEALAVQQDVLASEYEKTATEHEKLAAGK
jgi:hypothetical protein